MHAPRPMGILPADELPQGTQAVPLAERTGDETRQAGGSRRALGTERWRRCYTRHDPPGMSAADRGDVRRPRFESYARAASPTARDFRTGVAPAQFLAGYWSVPS